MLQVNLLPWRSIQQRRRQRLWVWHMMLFIVLTVVLMSLWSAFAWHALRREQSNLLMLSGSQTQLTLQLKKVSDATQQLHELLRVAREREQRRIKSLGYLALLTSIARHIPDNLWLTELIDEPDGRILLRGESAVYPAVMAFAQILKDDALFSEVRVFDIQRLPAQSLRFVLQIRLAKQPSAL